MSQIKLNDVLSLYCKVSGEMKHPEDERANGVTFEKIAYSKDGGFERFVNRAQKKIKEKKELLGDKENGLQENKEDMEKAREQFRQCFELMKSRNLKYGNSRKELRVSSIVDLMTMKLDRCQKQDLDDKALEVEFEDIINYGIFGLMNIRNK